MKSVKILTVTLLKALSLLTSTGAYGEIWDLPAELNDSNTTITFEVDSTWHLVHGTTQKIEGKASLADKKDPLSVNVLLHVPVQLFDTDSESRDERLQEVMASGTYPSVTFTSRRLSDSCLPTVIDKTGSCVGSLRSTLTMRDVTKEIDLPITITKKDGKYLIQGSLPVSWSDYNIEDPSILIAKLDPLVTISYQVAIPIKR